MVQEQKNYIRIKHWKSWVAFTLANPNTETLYDFWILNQH